MARELKWSTTIDNDNALASGSQTNIALLSNLDAANRRGSTITRIILRVTMYTDTVTTDGFLAFGIILLNNDAVAAGAFPDPNDAADNADWIMRDVLTTRMQSVSDGSQAARGNYDLRAQRLTRSAQDILHMVVNADGVGLEFHVYARILVRLP